MRVLFASTQSTGHFARFADGSGMVLDLGGNGGSGAWLQSTNVGNLAATYPLLLNPNGGNVGIGTGTTTPAARLDVNGNANVGGTLRVGVAAAPGQVLTPTTGTHNLLAVAYGQVGAGAALA